MARDPAPKAYQLGPKAHQKRQGPPDQKRQWPRAYDPGLGELAAGAGEGTKDAAGDADASGFGTASSFTGVWFPEGICSCFWQPPIKRQPARTNSPPRAIDGTVLIPCRANWHRSEPLASRMQENAP